MKSEVKNWTFNWIIKKKRRKLRLINYTHHIIKIIKKFLFQDKIRLLQDDLESERELRSRVSITHKFIQPNYLLVLISLIQ